MGITILYSLDNKNKDSIPLDEAPKENHQRPKEEIKSKGISADPHPKDRQSGTGRGKEMRKNGAGKNNWGNYQDDLKDYGEDDDLTDVHVKPNDQPPHQEEHGVKCTEKQAAIIIDDNNFPKLK